MKNAKINLLAQRLAQRVFQGGCAVPLRGLLARCPLVMAILKSLPDTVSEQLKSGLLPTINAFWEKRNRTVNKKVTTV